MEVEKFVIVEKPQKDWKEIGGLKREIQEIKEVIELCLEEDSSYSQITPSSFIGIDKITVHA